MNLKVLQIYASTSSWFCLYGSVTLVGVVTLGKSTNPYKNFKFFVKLNLENGLERFFLIQKTSTDLERVMSIESWDSPQCSTNVIGATPVGISEKGLVIESIFLHQRQ